MEAEEEEPRPAVAVPDATASSSTDDADGALAAAASSTSTSCSPSSPARRCPPSGPRLPPRLLRPPARPQHGVPHGGGDRFLAGPLAAGVARVLRRGGGGGGGGGSHRRSCCCCCRGRVSFFPAFHPDARLSVSVFSRGPAAPLAPLVLLGGGGGELPRGARGAAVEARAGDPELAAPVPGAAAAARRRRRRRRPRGRRGCGC